MPAERYREVFAALGRELEIAPLERATMEVIHADLIERFGGVHGVRDPERLEAALARPLQMAAYAPDASIPRLAGAMGFALLAWHPFVDGNKRAGLAAMLTFLERHGHTLEAAPTDVLSVMRAAAAGRMPEEEFLGWVERHARPAPGGPPAEPGP